MTIKIMYLILIQQKVLYENCFELRHYIYIKYKVSQRSQVGTKVKTIFKIINKPFTPKFVKKILKKKGNNLKYYNTW